MINYDKLSDIFVELTFLLRGYDYDDPDSEGQKLISLSYQEDSQPFQSIKDSMSYLWVSYSEADTNKQISVKSEIVNNELTVIKSQLRTVNVNWTFYGRDIPDVAYDFREKLISQQAKEFLDQFDIKIITDIPECVLMYEEINGRNWKRIDIPVSYYLTTNFTETINTFAQVNVQLRNDEIDLSNTDLNVKEEIK